MTETTDKRRRLMTADHWINTGDLPFQYLWFTYLGMSPSYELARKERAGELTDKDFSKLPADFDTVLSVFDDLGDLRGLDFETWWQKTGLRFLGNEGRMITAAPIGVLSETYNDPLNVVANRVHEFIEGVWDRQGKPTTALVSIPLGLTKTQVLDQIGFIFDRFDDETKVPTPLRCKYPVIEGKKDVKSLWSYLKCLTIKAQAPEAKLHEIGAIAEISRTYSVRVLDRTETAEDKINLRILTSRALDRGLMLAENAARGIFPSYVRNKNAVAPDWLELGDRLDEPNN